MTENRPQDYAALARGSQHREHGDQVAVFAYVTDLFLRKCYHHLMTDDQRRRCDAVDWYKLTFAVPNGAFLGGGSRTASRLKAEGLRPGVSDIIIMVPSGDYHGAGIELKRRTGRAPDDLQTAFGAALINAGYYWKVCYGYEEAIACIEWYVKGAYGP